MRIHQRFRVLFSFEAYTAHYSREKLKSIFNFLHVGSVCAVCVYAKGIEATVTFSFGKAVRRYSVA